MKDEALKQKLGMEQRNRGSVGFQEALAQPEPYDQTALELCNVCGWKTLIPDDACLNCERAQPEQEPVAWLHTKIEGVAVPHRPADLNKHPDRWEALYKTPPPCPTCEALARTVMLDQTSHDTTPPQRTWIGLTDEECRLIYTSAMEAPVRDQVTVCKAIEAKLKEKNT